MKIETTKVQEETREVVVSFAELEKIIAKQAGLAPGGSFSFSFGTISRGKYTYCRDDDRPDALKITWTSRQVTNCEPVTIEE